MPAPSSELGRGAGQGQLAPADSRWLCADGHIGANHLRKRRRPVRLLLNQFFNPRCEADRTQARLCPLAHVDESLVVMASRQVEEAYWDRPDYETEVLPWLQGLYQRCCSYLFSPS